jgi:hypothetical protein
MTENFKDPNQLDLFAGKLLTPDQQNKLITTLLVKTKTLPYQENENQRIERNVIEAGFIKGVISKMISNHQPLHVK